MRKLIVLIIVFCFVGLSYSGTQQTSSTAASSIITQVRANINELTEEFWKDTEILQWINDGVFDIVKRTQSTQALENISLIANQVEYAVTTTNYFNIVAVHYINAAGKVRALQLSSPFLVGNIEDVSEPEYFYDWSGKVGVFPALTAVTTQTIRLYLIPVPVAVTTTDNVPTPAAYDTALVFYATARAWAKDRQLGKWSAAMAAYEAELQRLRAETIPMPKKPER